MFGETWDMNFILEPEARNTAPALGLAALHLNRVDPEGIMVVFSADHAIRKSDEFLNILRKAAMPLRITISSPLDQADRPETGYGYIKAGEPCSGDDSTGVEKWKPS